MKGEILYKILDSIGDVMLDQVDFASAFLKAGYGASGGKIDMNFVKYRTKEQVDIWKKKRCKNSRII